MQMEKQRTVKTRNAMLTPRMTGTRVGGSTKFGWIPGGDCPAGSIFSKAGGILSIRFELILLADMITIIELLCHDNSDFRNERPFIDSIYFSIAIKSGSPCARIALPHVDVWRLECVTKGLHSKRRSDQYQAVWPSRWGANSGLAPLALAAILGRKLIPVDSSGIRPRNIIKCF